MNTESKKTILVVDDIELNRKILSVILESKYQIVEADNGISAQKVLERMGSQISLILLDIVMPEMDGLTFLKYLQGVKAYQSIPVILVTAEAYEENILSGIMIGARDVIAKPYTPELLFRRVDNLILLTESDVEEVEAPVPTPDEEEVLPLPTTVLIVDDIGINRAIIRGALEEKYDILEADNGLVALETLRKHQGEIAVVLLDIIMPVMDGFTLMHKAKRERLLDDIPVMAITTEDSAQKLSRIMEMGVCEVIQKPFTPSVIQNRVDYIVKLNQMKADR